jgi:hypothetical protein
MADIFERFNELHDRARPVYESLARLGIRVFEVSVKPDNARLHWIHPNKTVEQWRSDIREFRSSSEREDRDGGAECDVWNALAWHLRELGYIEIDDIVSDVYEGRITNERARLVDDPVHEEQADGFGHFGWENGRQNGNESDLQD